MDDAAPANVSDQQITLVSVDPDWSAIQSRYLAGDTLADIGTEFNVLPGTIAVRAHREKWKAQQIKALLADPKALSEDVRGNLLLSIWKDSRFFAALDPTHNAEEMELWARVRDRLLVASSKLLRWDDDPVTSAKRAKCIDL